MRVIVDSRKQAPFPFRGPRYEGVTVEVGALSVGDYSLAGLADKVAVERKELSDLVACLGRERERFERELQRAAALDALARCRHSGRRLPARAWRHSWGATACPSSLPEAAPPPNTAHGLSSGNILRGPGRGWPPS